MRASRAGSCLSRRLISIVLAALDGLALRSTKKNSDMAAMESGISEFVVHKVAKIDLILFSFLGKLTAEVRSQGHCCESCHSQ